MPTFTINDSISSLNALDIGVPFDDRCASVLVHADDVIRHLKVNMSQITLLSGLSRLHVKQIELKNVLFRKLYISEVNKSNEHILYYNVET